MVNQRQFQDRFKGRAIVLTDLPQGRPRGIAEEVNESVGRGDATLYTKAEYVALFHALLKEPDSRAPAEVDPSSGTLLLTTAAGDPTVAGLSMAQFAAASIRSAEFFAEPMYVVSISGWPRDNLKPDKPTTAPDGASLRVWRTDPGDARHAPPEGASGTLFASSTFSLSNSGNRTAYAPKRSWKINLGPGEDEDRIAGMTRLNLKAMWNDPSQLREAVAWSMFADAAVPAPRHTFAKLVLDGDYKGLFSVIEEVDRAFLKNHFGANDRGNLYKAYCGNLGCATLEYRRNAQGGGSAYQSAEGADPDDATYRLKTNEDDPARNTYDDLATLVRTINGVELRGGAERFGTDAFRSSVEDRLNVKAFLRWAGVNVLLGSWDNYFATPANYYLYNSGRQGDEDAAVADPFFTFIPWDYDNSLGIDRFTTQWQYADLLDWPSSTRGYWAQQGHDGVSALPLVTNLFANHDFAQYYLDQLEYLLDTRFTPDAVSRELGMGDGDGLWQRISQAAYLESDTQYGRPFTERQFTNDDVYRAGHEQQELHQDGAAILGIYHYVRMRYDRARSELEKLRTTYPAGASGASFPAAEEILPARR
jgi:spore coat protein CotH